MATTANSTAFATASFSSKLEGNEYRVATAVAALAVVLFVLYQAFSASEVSSYPGYPMIGKDPSEKTNWPAQQRWFASARDILYGTLAKTSKPFQVIATSGPLIIFPAHYSAEIRSDERLTFKSWLKKDFFTSYPGYVGFAPSVDNNVFIDSVRTGLTAILGQITPILADEAKLSIAELFPRTNEWKETHFDECAFRLIARMSARTFLPEPICHNEEWLRLSVQYTVDIFHAIYTLRAYPPILRPFVHWFLPSARKIRQDVKLAEALIRPVVNERLKQQEADRKAGRPVTRPIDAISWVEQTSEKSGEYMDPVWAQLNYSLGAVHTTTLTFAAVVYDLVANPQYIDLLRKEIIEVFGQPGIKWTKQSLSKLKLMDSCMRESNRLHPATLMAVNRVAEQTITLSDGHVIPKGAALTVPNTRLTDPEYYPDPLKFKGERFYHEGQTAEANLKVQFVTTSDDYLPFGHGKHACPGRFFASNEIKVLLVHLLMQYDFKFPEDQGRPEVKFFGLDRSPDVTSRTLFKARKSEISLDF